MYAVDKNEYRHENDKAKALTNLPCFDVRPLEALDVQADHGQGGEEDDGLETGLLPLVVLGFGGPVEEGDDVLGHLGCRCGSACLGERRSRRGREGEG